MNDAPTLLAALAIIVFFLFASVCAVIASLERILARPIPQLRHSRAIRRNRLFWVVPISMTAVIAWLSRRTFDVTVCSHCNEPYAWQHFDSTIWLAALLTGFGGAVGWIVYFVLLAVNFLIGLFSRSSL